MAITKLITSGVNNIVKYDSFLAGNTAYEPSPEIIVASSTNKISTSLDGISWKTKTLPSSYGGGGGVAWSGSLWAMVQTAGNGIAYTSSDGITWTERTKYTSGDLDLNYGNGKWVASAQAGEFEYSTDGTSWTGGTYPSTHTNQRVRYGGSIWVTICSDSTNVAYSSTTGTSWTSRTMPASGQWYALAYGNGTFAALVLNSTQAATSTNGTTWTSRTSAASDVWVDMDYGNSLFVAIAQDSSGSGAMSSSDGITWTSRSLPSSATFTRVRWSTTAGVFVAVAANSTTAATSSNGTTWTARTLSANAGWQGLGTKG